MHVNVWIKRAALAALACVFVGCGGGGGGSNGSGSDDLYIVYFDGADTRLATINRNNAGDFQDIGALGTGTELVNGLDLRPETGDLYAYNQDFNELLILNTATGNASLVGGNSSTILGDVSIEFNPVADNVRLITTFEDNVRLSSTTGAVVGTDTDLAPAGTITDIAYSNNTSNASVTTLYGIDAEFNELVRIGGVDGNPSPNQGAVSIVGALGVNPEVAYFDIDSDGTAWMVDSDDQGAGVFLNRLYRVNLNTGAATLVGTIPIDDPIYGLAAG